MSVNSNNSQSNEAEKVEESLRDFIGRVRNPKNEKNKNILKMTIF